MKNGAEKELILIVDDSPKTLEMLERNLRAEGYDVVAAPDVAEAIRILDDAPADLVITDLKMPGTSGMDLIRYVRENLKNTEVMMITGYATVEGAVNAIKAGYRHGEMSWILENNMMMNRDIQTLGGQVYKTYRIMDRPL